MPVLRLTFSIIQLLYIFLKESPMFAKVLKTDVRVIVFVLTVVLFVLGAGAPGTGGI
jgi:hypothetical protein